MRSLFPKLLFAAVWVALFVELLFNSTLHETALGFCQQHAVFAPLLLISAQLCLASLALPCSPLTVLAGILWGLEIGILYSTIATFLSSLWTFFLGRHLLGQRLSHKFQTGIWAEISRLITTYGWKASMLAHINPIFPGSSLGYAFGLSSISLRGFLVGVLLGTLPLQCATVGVGFLLGKSSNNIDINFILPASFLVAVLFVYQRYIPVLIASMKRPK